MRLWVMKERVIGELQQVLGKERASIAARDPHARRRPRPCGITIHPGHGCPLRCVYCYIYDMGFGTEARPYPLSGEEMAYALARNPYVVPERTLAAFGSVTEPLLPVLRRRTLEYAEAIARWLKLPIQLSTKLLIDGEISEKLRDADPGASILVSVSTLRHWRKVEPNAPDPLLRIRAATEAVRKGLRVDLFLRPIIPGLLTREELRELLHEAKKAGFTGVVAGSLRVTKGIVNRLRASGLSLSVLEDSLARIKLTNKQVPVPDRATKEAVRAIASEVGLEYLPSACAANVRAHGIGCALCKFGPCGTPPRPDETDVEEFLELLGLKGAARFSSSSLKVVVKGHEVRKRRLDIIKAFLSEVYKRRVVLQIV